MPGLSLKVDIVQRSRSNPTQPKDNRWTLIKHVCTSRDKRFAQSKLDPLKIAIVDTDACFVYSCGGGAQGSLGHGSLNQKEA